jgi:IstB-like ATP binding protein
MTQTPARTPELNSSTLEMHHDWPITTNLPFAEWVTIFAGDEKLTTALLDRLAHHAAVITTKGKSYRMRQRERPARDDLRRAAQLDSSAELPGTEGGSLGLPLDWMEWLATSLARSQ